VIEIKTERTVSEIVAQLFHRKTVFSYSSFKFLDFTPNNYLTLQREYRYLILLCNSERGFMERRGGFEIA
jgi:hypothetical protein